MESAATRPNLFAYRDPVQFIADTFDHRRTQDPGFTLRTWAKREMGLKSADVLLLILQRKRPLRLKHVEFIEKGIPMDSLERLYLQTLIQLAGAQSEEERGMFELLMRQISPGAAYRIASVPDEELFSHWLHATILSIAQMNAGLTSPREIRSHLSEDVSPEEIEAALETLKRHQLLREAAPGEWEAVNDRVTTRNDRAHRGGQQYVQQVSVMAAKATQLPLDEREFQCFSMAIDSRSLPLLKDLMRSFRNQLTKIPHAAPDQVVQVNLQLFPMTKRPAAQDRPPVHAQPATETRADL